MVTMDLQPYIDDVVTRVAQAAEIGGPEVVALAERLMTPVDASMRLVLINALSAAARVISAELAPGHVDVRVADGDPNFVVVVPEVVSEVEPNAAPAPIPATQFDDSGMIRTTLRWPENLKTRAEAAAAEEGVSVNTWLVRAVNTALTNTSRTARSSSPSSSPSHFKGWAS
jgi:hypothetical protein